MSFKFSFKKLFLFLILFIFIFIYYGFTLFQQPFTLKEHTLTNGQKNIIFQEMSHIGETSFYNKVNDNLLSYREKGFVYFYEQVKIHSEEEAKKLQELTGLKVDIYSIIGELTNLDNQNNHVSHITKEDINADITGTELIRLIEDYYENNPKEEVQEIKIEGLEELGNLEPYQKDIVKTVMRFILQQTINNKEVFEEQGILKEIILQARDQVLFEYLINSNYNNIVVHYGAFHFHGVWEKLKKHDNKWKIVSQKDIVVF